MHHRTIAERDLRLRATQDPTAAPSRLGAAPAARLQLPSLDKLFHRCASLGLVGLGTKRGA
eukprot:5138845-Prymnesium_polylepis.1